jgi:hypothetical protein
MPDENQQPTSRNMQHGCNTWYGGLTSLFVVGVVSLGALLLIGNL